MNILFATSECVPFIKTGGLADVAGSLPKALKDKNTDIRVVMPLYANISEKYKKKMKKVDEFDVGLNWRKQTCEIFSLKNDGVMHYFLGNDYYFNREGGIYGHYDDGERFLFYSKAVLEMLPYIDYIPDIMHCNDWHTAIIPYLANTHYKPHYTDMKTVLTIHNIKYQGIYGRETLFDILDLKPEEITLDFEYNDAINIMKSGIYNADWITTVSPSYARELEFDYFGEGLEGVISVNRYKMTGILNGIDYDAHNPAKDKNLYAAYTRSYNKKQENKEKLLEELGLEYDENRPVIGMITRLDELKGIDLVMAVGKEIMDLDVNLVLLGTGEEMYEDYFRYLESQYPEKMSARIMFDSKTASRIYAGSDIMLMPSRVEPCGLNQIIALKYGTVPVVRNTGGLGDTIFEYDEVANEGNGFKFDDYNAHAMLFEIEKAVDIYKNNRESWKKLVANAFKCKYDWKASAAEYKKVYKNTMIRQEDENILQLT
ncbi:starch synthase [Dethiosulfatibacter aminovorans DSM 17477]|uniref:Glycogen synthase n=1 Tax=Dethiosulfatibacter aminovorans DSM 17477 TaxID=1121476 RepID=A0A1M6ADQ9_9FIRM|nr:glycogen synthase GlgA [Dethiosulfatibacter aminovorans]SHI34323.1 starch synthase [Dethiosulfatibacter aminovorans DSM 17477]